MLSRFSGDDRSYSALYENGRSRALYLMAKRLPAGPFLGFQYFTETAKSRLLWRLIVRTANRSPANKKELLSWARAEFEAHRHETDPEKIKFLVADGLKRTREIGDMFG